MIQFDNISRSYGRKMAVDRLSLTVPPGELFALLGPNGAGKTTTIKMLVGLLRPDAGSVRVCSRDVSAETRAAARCLGYVPDEPYLYEKLSGREFLEFSGEMRGLDRATIAARIARESALFDLADFLDDLIETYSHGMRQRIVVAASGWSKTCCGRGLRPARRCSYRRTRWPLPRKSPIGSASSTMGSCALSGPSPSCELTGRPSTPRWSTCFWS